MNRSKRRVAGLGAGALAVTLVAATFAYYTSNASVDNLFHTSDYGWRTVEEFTPEQTVEPGSKITKDVTVENTGGSDLVVRVKMEEKWVYDGEDDPFITLASSNDAFHSVVFDGEADPNTYTATQAGVSGATDGQTAGDESVMYKLLSDSPNWKLGTDGYWYYTKLLGQGETTDSLLEAVIMATNADMGLYQNTDVLYSVASVDTINSLKEAVEAAQTAYDEDPSSENLEALTQAQEALESGYGWTTSKPEDVSTITFVQRGNALQQGAKGYANADYTLTITTEVVQATSEAVASEWGTLPNEKGEETQITITGLSSSQGN